MNPRADPLGMVLDEVVDGPAHLLMNRRDIAPHVVDPRACASAAKGIALFRYGTFTPYSLALIAAIHPASPPPMISTSVSIGTTSGK